MAAALAVGSSAVSCHSAAMHIGIFLLDLASAGERLEAAETRHRLLGADAAFSGHRRLTRIAARIAVMQARGPEAARRPFAVAPGGKPELPDTGLHVSVSHSGSWAAIALSEVGPIGIDIEALRDVTIALPRRASILAAGRRVSADPLEGQSEDARFISAWTRIEAAAKAGGAGALPMLAWLGGRGTSDPGLQRYTLSPPHDLRLDGLAYAVSALPVGPTAHAAICHPRVHGVTAPRGHDALLAGVLT